jgi:hypothetical protein
VLGAGNWSERKVGIWSFRVHHVGGCERHRTLRAHLVHDDEVYGFVRIEDQLRTDSAVRDLLRFSWYCQQACGKSLTSSTLVRFASLVCHLRLILRSVRWYEYYVYMRPNNYNIIRVVITALLDVSSIMVMANPLPQVTKKDRTHALAGRHTLQRRTTDPWQS